MGEVAGQVVIVGAGGHAMIVAEALDPGAVAGHLAPSKDSTAPQTLGPWLGTDGDAAGLASSGHRFALGLGFVDTAGALRRALVIAEYANIGVCFRTVAHPTAVVSRSAVLGLGVFIGANAVVGPGVHLGDGVLINTGAVVDHDCRLGSNVHVAPGATLSGGVVVGSNSLIGTGASVRQQISIGSDSIVGVGAAVVADVGSDSAVAGVPARTISR